MSKAEWGTKRRCTACDTPFYDMRRSPIRCPACGAEFKPNASRPRPATRRPATSPAWLTAPVVPDARNVEVDEDRSDEDVADNHNDQVDEDGAEEQDDTDDVPEDPEELASLDGPERA